MLVPYKSPATYLADRGRPKIAKGTKLYAIQHKGLFFIWSYIDEEYAKRIDEKMYPGFKDEADKRANWRRYVEQLTPSGRIKD